MQQIADWLKQLGMSEYAERFAENRIDLSVLPDLTDQDLEKLGVVLGDRRKMLRAIASLKAVEATNLCCDCGTCCASETGHRRTSPSHCNVLGPRGLNRPLRPHGP